MNHSPFSPSVCQRCAAQGVTCCSVSGGDLEFCFPVSAAEMAAIQATGDFGPECFVPAPNTAGFVDQLAHLLPDLDVRQMFPATSSHWRLAVTEAGNCIFLGEAGCRLERNVRPNYCRLFPLWSYQGQLTWFSAPTCLANQECAALQEMLAAMHTDKTEINTLFDEMCSALGLGRHGRDKE